MKNMFKSTARLNNTTFHNWNINDNCVMIDMFKNSKMSFNNSNKVLINSRGIIISRAIVKPIIAA